VGLFFRVLFLPADAPTRITRSQDFSTDPPQYTYFAQNLVERGESNPYDDPRFGQWEYSSQNLLAIGVYAILGVGRAQGNLVAIIFNLLTILLLTLAIRNFGSRIGALFFAVFASLDFTLIWFARTPFLEASQNFWICAAVYFFSLHRGRTWAVLAAGASCALGAFFGKMIALYMLGPFTALWFVLYFTVDQNRGQLLKNAAIYYGGFAVVAVGWLLAIYLPAQSQVGGYFAEQALGLYGSPKAFESLAGFFSNFNTLLWETDFFIKMPLITILGFLGGGVVLYGLSRSGNSGRWFRDINPGWVLITFWFIVGYLSLFPWNYRPLRYQTTIMFPAMALAGFLLALLWRNLKGAKDKSGKKTKPELRLWQLALTWGAWLMPLLACLLFWITKDPKEFYYRPFLISPIAYSLVIAIAGALLGLISHYAARQKWLQGDLLKVGGIVVIVVFMVINITSFVKWADVRQYSLITADRDIAAITNEGAVLSGPYGPALSLNNNRGAVVHMFGVVEADKELFARFPITHLIMDEGNEERALKDYPAIMSSAWTIARYYLRGVATKVYNITEGSPHPDAQAYIPTDYELAQKFIAAGNEDSAQVFMARYLESDIANYSADLYVGDALVAIGEFERAVDHYRKVQEFVPNEPVSALNMGSAMLSIGSSTSNPAWFDSALVYYRIAQKAYPSNSQINNTVSQLERRKQ
jgi:tetratricopeptide (TPR) repeat protein